MGILTIMKSKGDKDRLVYLPEDGIEMIAAHKQRMEKEYPAIPWMFPGYDPEKPISCSRVEGCFNRCWNRLPFASKIDKHPTPHCLRHAFVVERLNDWMMQGVDINRLLPYLSKYLGHKSPSETFYYYHLVNKSFEVIRQKDTTSKRVIPEVILYEND